MTVERLEREMSRQEFEEWIEFVKLEPFGNEEKMSDYRNALTCKIIAQSRGKDNNIDDFLIYHRETKKINIEEMDEEQIKVAQKTIFQIFTMG